MLNQPILNTYIFCKTLFLFAILKTLAPCKDLIIEAKEPPKTTPETTIINVQTIKELAKTAEILAKPIILTRKPQPTLTIIDQNTIYQHKP